MSQPFQKWGLHYIYPYYECHSHFGLAKLLSLSTMFRVCIFVMPLSDVTLFWQSFRISSVFQTELRFPHSLVPLVHFTNSRIIYQLLRFSFHTNSIIDSSSPSTIICIYCAVTFLSFEFPLFYQLDS